MTVALPIAAAGSRALSLGVFALVLGITLGVTAWAARQVHSATDFYSAGRNISGAQNGIAVAGEFLSAAAFLGVAGLMFLDGFDGYLTGIAALLSFVPVLYLLAERMRNAGRYTMTDVLAFRLSQRPARTAAGITTLCIAAFYVVAQSVAAGALFEALVGIPFWVAVLLTVAAMLAYVLFGGMVATTWVQIIKASLLLGGVATMAIWVLAKYGFNPSHLLDDAARKSGEGSAYLGPGLAFPKPLDEISVGMAFVLGTCGLPHILMRFRRFPTRARPAARSAGPSGSSASSTCSSRSSASGRGRSSGRAARSSRATAGTWRRPTSPRSWVAGPGAWVATSSSRSSRRSRSRRSSPWSPASCWRRPARSPTTCGRTS